MGESGPARGVRQVLRTMVASSASREAVHRRAVVQRVPSRLGQRCLGALGRCDGLARGLDLLVRQTRQIDQRSLAKLGALAEGLAQQHSGRRTAIRNDVDVHAYINRRYASIFKAEHMPTFRSAKNRPEVRCLTRELTTSRTWIGQGTSA